MKISKPIIHNLSIVLVGNFNPSIVTPSWLALKKLIRESEVDSAEIKVIHPELSHFSLHFVDLQISKDKFIINCDNEAEFDLAKDLAISIFTFLKETPVHGIGLNYISHFQLNNEDEYKGFGNWLAPHSIWETELTNPKLLDLKIIEPFQENSPVKNMVTISPSDVLKPFGVRFQLNYHIELIKTNSKSTCNEILNHWNKGRDKSNRILSSIIDNYKI